MTMPSSEKKIIIIVHLLLALLTLVAYEPLRHNDFISLDDKEYVVNNPNVTRGITVKSIIWAFTTPHSGNWHSLTWLSHMLDCSLFDLNPAGHHMTSLLLHVLGTLLLFFVMKKMTGALWPSAFIAAAFALHPVHVESVAWVAERKDVLSGFFWILTMLAYVLYTERPGVMRYLLIVLSLCLGLLSKPMLVTLPFVLLLLDYWPLERLRPIHRGQRKKSETTEDRFQQISWQWLVLEKVPVFVLVIIACVITFLVQRSAGAAKLTEILPMHFRLSNALVSYLSYIGKTLYPTDLAVFYPLNKIPTWQPVVSCIALIVISILVVISRRKYLVVGWLWYLGTLVPVIGLVQVGSQAMADRYTYIPSIGLFIMIAYTAAEFIPKWRIHRISVIVSALLLLSVLVFAARTQVKFWKDSTTLYKHAIDVTKDNSRMLTYYGAILLQDEKLDEARLHFEQALRIRPGYVDAVNHLAQILLLQGDVYRAIDYFNAVLAKKMDCPDVYCNLGLAYSTLDRDKLAVANLTKCIQMDPNNANSLNNLAWILATTADTELQNPAQAVVYAVRSCQLNPDDPGFLDTLAAAYAASGNFNDALKTIERAIELAESENQMDLADEIRTRLELYKSGHTYIRR